MPILLDPERDEQPREEHKAPAVIAALTLLTGVAILVFGLVANDISIAWLGIFLAGSGGVVGWLFG